MGWVQNYNLYVRLSPHEKLLRILCVGSTDSVKVAIAFKSAQEELCNSVNEGCLLHYYKSYIND